MPTATYTPLQTLTLGSNQATVTFANIPNTYKDLILIMNVEQSATSGNGGTIIINGDTGANYSTVFMSGNGSSASSGTGSSSNSLSDLFFFESVRATHIIQFLDYSATDKHKTVLARANVSSFQVRAGAGRWANTNAVTSFTLGMGQSRSYTSGSTFSLYGILG